MTAPGPANSAAKASRQRVRRAVTWICTAETCLAAKSRLLTCSVQSERRTDHFGGLFCVEDDPKKKPDKEEEKAVKGILERLRHFGYDSMVESNIEYALRANNRDSDAAFWYLILLQDTLEGVVKPYNPDAKLLGAVNRDSVTCYLDALLFAMFARLDSFEAMLYDNFDDIPRRKLAGLLRVWVNMLRTGRLITTDVTAYLQAALAECGWSDAAKLRQQDPSEAFTFITGQLELPLLTLKMDLYHTGKEDPQDDHKFVNERLLEVAIPEDSPNGRNVITLEDCLEHYFNNRIEVKRHMENRRRNTIKSEHSAESALKVEKESGMHIEVLEMDGRPDTPVVQTPVAETPTQTKTPVENLRSGSARKRADSIFSQRKVELNGVDPDRLRTTNDSNLQDAQDRKLSTRTEVLMPAWQFFKLLPWYTDHLPMSDAQVAAHFSKKRPVLGICLKRYAYTYSGQATRRGTYIDIPLEIGVPNFVSDDNMQEDGPLAGNFRLMLQSVVCHRGMSVTSGHYVTLCRGQASNAHHQHFQAERRDSDGSADIEDPWMRFDDLARERVSFVDIHEALRQETPYLLFYQVVPIGDDGHSIHDLPSYTEATSRSQSDVFLEKPYQQGSVDSETALSHTDSLVRTESEASQPKTDAADFAISSARTSIDAGVMLSEDKRGRPSFTTDGRPRSMAFNDSTYAASTSGGSAKTDAAICSVPTTPIEEKGGGFLSVAGKISASRRGSRMSKSSTTSRSRPSSAGPDGSSGNRFSLNMSKLAQRMNRAGEGPVLQQPASSEATAVLEGSEQSDAAKSLPTAATAVSLPPRSSSDGRDSVATAKPSPPKARKDKAAAKHERRKGRGHGDDRDCTVM